MGDQLIDALVGVLPALVGGDQIRVEGSDALSPFGERSPQPRVFPAKLLMRLDECFDGALESIEVAGFRG